mgnify:CR=1 FL=1
MSSASRRAFLSLVLGIASALLVAATSYAQPPSRTTGPPNWPSAPYVQKETVVDAKEMRRVDELLQGIAETVQELSSTPSALAQHREMIEGMNEALAQLQVVHRHLQAMLADPALLQNHKAAIAFSRVHRRFAKTAATPSAVAPPPPRAARGAPLGPHQHGAPP